MGESAQKSLYLNILSYNTEHFRESTDSIPDYKFYTHLWHKLKKTSLAYGTPLHEFAMDIKKALLKDGHFESKCASEIRGGIFNQAMVTFISWGFIYSTIKMTGIKMPLKELYLTGITQCLGFACYFSISSIIKKKTFQHFNILFECTYNLKAQLQMKQDMTYIMEGLNFHQLFTIEKKELKAIVEHINILIKKNMALGECIVDDLRLIIEDLWELQEFYYQEFLKMLSILRIFVLLFFFLMPYFFILYTILQTLSTQL